MRCLILFGVFVVGCSSGEKGDFTPLSCTDDVGDDGASDDQRVGLDAANCYRNLMGLEAGVLGSQVNTATQSHAEYMSGAGKISHQQSQGRAGYTGEWVWDRIAAEGRPIVGGEMVSEVVSSGYGPAEAVDGWMQTVYHRMPFTLPLWVEVGFGQSGKYSSMTFVSEFPDGPRQGIIYPVDGQSDVPPSFQSDWEWPDPAPDHGEVGMPITVTVADETMGTDDQDPYDTRLIYATLMDEAGTELEVLLGDAGDDEYLYQMAMMIPVEPLTPGAAYVATMIVSWMGEEETFTSTFTTASASE